MGKATCDCVRFPAMHDRHGVCVNWLRHAETIQGVRGPISVAASCDHGAPCGHYVVCGHYGTTGYCPLPEGHTEDHKSEHCDCTVPADA